MGAGELNRKVTVEARQALVDDLNQSVPGDWSFHKSMWVNIKGQTGMASIRGSAPEQGIARELNGYSFRGRFSATNTVTVGMRIVHLGVRFDIKQIRHDYDRREWTDYVCEAGGNND